MTHKEYLSNYIYILNYKYIFDNGCKFTCLHALDTHYMVACTIDSTDLIDLSKSRKVTIRNINEHGICNIVNDKQKVVLFKCDKELYMVADYYCNLTMMTLSDIKEHRSEYPDIQFVGKGITTGSGKVPNINKRALNIYKMQSFNAKAAMLGISTLEYDFDYDNDLIITGLRTEKDRLEIPNFATYIANRAFINSNIKYVKIGRDIKIIGSNAFANCSELESVELGESVETIENRAFFRCLKLKRFCINNNLKEIYSDAFLYSGIACLNKQPIKVRVDDTIRRMLDAYR